MVYRVLCASLMLFLVACDMNQGTGDSSDTPPLVQEPEAAPEPETNPEPESSPEPEATPEPEANPEPEVIPEPEGNPEPEVIPEPEMNPEPETNPEPEVIPEPEMTPEPEPQADPAEFVDVERTLIEQLDDIEAEADGESALRVAVTVFDAEDQPVSGVTVEFFSDAGNQLSITQGPETDANGRTIAEVSSELQGTIVLEARLPTLDVILPVTTDLTFDACLTSREYFQRKVYGPVMNKCIGCHNEYGLSNEFGVWAGKFDGQPASDSDSDFWEHNFDIVSQFLQPQQTLDGDFLPRFLAKPAMLLPEGHEGGEVFERDSEEFLLMQELTTRMANNKTCPPGKPAIYVDAYEADESFSNAEIYRKAGFILTGRIPGIQEIEQYGASEETLSEGIDALMESDGFYDRMESIFNDLLHTNLYQGGIRALINIQPQNFPRRYFFRPCSQYNNNCCQEPEDANSPDMMCCKDIYPDENEADGFCTIGKQVANRSASREPLKLIRYLLEHPNDNDFQDNFRKVLSANRTVVNPYLAAIYGYDPMSLGFDDYRDEDEWIPLQIQPVTDGNRLAFDMPHAGIFSSPQFMARYPTSNTNLNRHRAKKVYDKFLGIDLLKLAEFKLDANEVLPFNATYSARSCRTCHAAMDPMSGYFRNWNGGSRFAAVGNLNLCSEEFTDLCVRGPGYKGEEDTGDMNRILPRLAEQITEDDRFSLAIVRFMHQALVGIETIPVPTDIQNPDYEAQLDAFMSQTESFEAVRQHFVQSGYNLRVLIKSIILGNVFNIKSITPKDAHHAKVLEYAQVGGGALISPELLDSKIESLTGFPWRYNRSKNGPKLLLDNNWFKILYGGTDDNNILKRQRTPSPMAANIARRMGTEMACVAVPQDFAIRDPAQRRFFTASDLDVEPNTPASIDPDTSEAIASGKDRIIGDIQRLFLLFYAEELEADDPEILAAYYLFQDVWSAGKERILNGDGDSMLPSHCQATRDYYAWNVNFNDNNPTHRRIDNDETHVIRAWQAVFAYLVTDYRFLFQ